MIAIFLLVSKVNVKTYLVQCKFDEYIYIYFNY